MNQVQHTPGPWRTGASEETCVFGGPDDELIADCGGSAENARFVATAPNMLEALAKLANEVLGSLPLMEPLARREFGNSNYNILIQRAEEARAVIAKAVGEVRI